MLTAALLSVAALPADWLVEWVGDGACMTRERERAAEMDRQLAVLGRRLDVKERIAARVVRGEMTLLQASAWFRALNETSEYPDDYRRVFPGASDGERLCRQVIGWARSRARIQSESLAAEVEARLEGDLRKHLAHHGTVELPEE
jgi:hypothetical protein